MPDDTQDDSVTFGPLLATARKAAGLTQAQAAERCGLATQHWSDLERDRRQPGFQLMRRIVKRLGIPCCPFFAEPKPGG